MRRQKGNQQGPVTNACSESCLAGSVTTYTTGVLSDAGQDRIACKDIVPRALHATAMTAGQYATC